MVRPTEIKPAPPLIFSPSMSLEVLHKYGHQCWQRQRIVHIRSLDPPFCKESLDRWPCNLCYPEATYASISRANNASIWLYPGSIFFSPSERPYSAVCPPSIRFPLSYHSGFWHVDFRGCSLPVPALIYVSGKTNTSDHLTFKISRRQRISPLPM
jgi:hypothetical protein